MLHGTTIRESHETWKHAADFVSSMKERHSRIRSGKVKTRSALTEFTDRALPPLTTWLNGVWISRFQMLVDQLQPGKNGSQRHIPGGPSELADACRDHECLGAREQWASTARRQAATGSESRGNRSIAQPQQNRRHSFVWRRGRENWNVRSRRTARREWDER